MIDCKITENFFKEYIRMCEGEPFGCKLCPISEAKGGTLSYFIEEKPQKVIEIVQKWSDEHPCKTIAQDLLEKYPNAQLRNDGTTPNLCAKILGYEVDCAVFKYGCAKCWQTPLDEVIKK